VVELRAGGTSNASATVIRAALAATGGAEARAAGGGETGGGGGTEGSGGTEGAGGTGGSGGTTATSGDGGAACALTAVFAVPSCSAGVTAAGDVKEAAPATGTAAGTAEGIAAGNVAGDGDTMGTGATAVAFDCVCATKGAALCRGKLAAGAGELSLTPVTAAEGDDEVTTEPSSIATG